MEKEKRTIRRFLNKNFVLLWQGQLVSALGDVVYEIALGFWILATTGSTALMGSLMAATAIPRFVLGPLAGVWVDRGNRKAILVWMDIIRGVAIVTVGILALTGFLKVWMVFIAGILTGICASLFNPGVNSVMPDLVEKPDLQKANSAFSIIYSGSGILGNSLGGFLFSLLGAPVMFLSNGISYLFSAFTELFISIPQVHHPEKTARNPDSEKTDFKNDFKEGLRFTWNNKGLRYLVISASSINFFANIGLILFLPLFQRSETLGATNYGFAMATLAIGSLLGMVFLMILKIPEKKRFVVFSIFEILMILSFSLFSLTEIFPLMLVLIGFAGIAMAIVNIMIETIFQLTIPQYMRGKVFALRDTLSQGLTPIAMAIGGVLGEFLPIKWVIFGSFLMTFIVVLPSLSLKDFRDFIGYELHEDNLQKRFE